MLANSRFSKVFFSVKWLIFKGLQDWLTDCHGFSEMGSTIVWNPCVARVKRKLANRLPRIASVAISEHVSQFQG